MVVIVGIFYTNCRSKIMLVGLLTLHCGGMRVIVG